MSRPETDPHKASTIVRMPPETKMVLVNALLDCPSVQRRSGRDAIIGLLPALIQHATVRDDNSLTDVLSLVSAALNYEGGLASSLKQCAASSGTRCR